MELNSIIILLSIFSGIALTFILIYVTFPKLFFLENISPFSFEDTIKRFDGAVTAKGWKTPAVHDLKEIMEKNGNPGLSHIKVFEICNPELAFRILSEDKARFASSMLPCRVSIYEKADGFVYISRMRTSLMAYFMSRLISRAMFSASRDVEGIIKNALHR